MNRYINYDDCEGEIGFTGFQLLYLTGIFGIYSIAGFNALYLNGDIEYKFYFDEDDDFFVEIKGKEVKILKINIKSKDELHLDYFRIDPTFKGKNIGFNRHKSQIEAAKIYGFKKITLWAYGDINMYPDWDGYIIWGKYGFSMYELAEIFSFNILMSDDRLLHCSTINDLVYSKEGTAYWKHLGNDWQGEFILDDNSHHMNVYRRYGQERGLL